MCENDNPLTKIIAWISKKTFSNLIGLLISQPAVGCYTSGENGQKLNSQTKDYQYLPLQRHMQNISFTDSLWFHHSFPPIGAWSHGSIINSL